MFQQLEGLGNVEYFVGIYFILEFVVMSLIFLK